MVEQCEHRCRQLDKTSQRKQEHNAHHQGERQTYQTGGLTPRRRQSFRNNGNEDDVIDAEDNLEQRKGGKTQPNGGIGQIFNHNAS